METLLLSRGYEPLERISWQRALTLWFRDKVEVLETYDRVVRSPSVELAMPSVVRILEALRRRPNRVTFSRANVFARDSGRCQYCLRALRRGEATYDHVLPRRLGGRTTWENIVIACLACNQKKGGRTPDQANMRLHSVPVRPRRLEVRLQLRPEEVPPTWRQYLVDDRYWNAPLERDG